MEPSGETLLESVWKRAGSLKRYLAGDWMNHLSIAIYRKLAKPDRNGVKMSFPWRDSEELLSTFDISDEIASL